MVRIEKQITIDAPKAQVWAVLADFGNVHAWAPGVTHSYSTSDNNGGDGASRHCDIKGFGSGEEDVLDWQEGRSFRYRATALGPIGESISVWEVQPQGGGRSKVVTTFEFLVRFGPLGAAMMVLFMRRKVNRAFDQTLRSLKAFVEQPVSAAA